MARKINTAGVTAEDIAKLKKQASDLTADRDAIAAVLAAAGNNPLFAFIREALEPIRLMKEQQALNVQAVVAECEKVK
jgi:hypothetical protein